MPTKAPKLTTNEPVIKMTCDGCAKEQKTKATPKGIRLPKSWKSLKDGGDVKNYCSDCWNKRYIMRAVTFPVAGPVANEGETQADAWKRLRESLKAGWSDTTSAANFIVSELYAADVRREPGMEKLPPMQAVYLYPKIRARFPNMSTACVVAMDHAIQGKYRAIRWELLWTCGVSLPNFRYPVPLSVGAQGWSCEYGKDKIPVISARIGETRFKLRLRGGHQFRRQLAAFDKMVSGEARCTELALYQQRVQQNDNRPGASSTGPSTRLMAKLVAWLPRSEVPEHLSGELFVRTDKDSLLIALDLKGERVWAMHGDHLRRWSMEHSRKLNRWSDDQKAEQRPEASFGKRREAAVLKYRNRIDTGLHEASVQLANFAARRKYAVVKLNISEHGFCERLPWFKLTDLIRQKLDARGIELVVEKAKEKPAAEPEPLAETEG